MTQCITKGCGSYAINHDSRGRDGSDPASCDVCFWRARALRLDDICASPVRTSGVGT